MKGTDWELIDVKPEGEVVCDFCASTPVRWRYPCLDHESWGFSKQRSGWGFPLHGESKGDWAACDKCRALIENGKWEKLARRSVSRLLLAYGMGAQGKALQIVDEVKKAHVQFRKNRCGPAERVK